MKKFFQKFKRDCRGAVTVFVTLLLIPAVLISGTGVDLARVYTARSLVRDGNQLAANAMLAEYDALLQDLYGLYGVMAEDEELAAMVDEYIRLSLGMSENSVTSDEEGAFALFRGSELEPGSITPDEDQNLANAAVLRRQIEEYAKFRAPVVIVKEVLDRLDSFKKVTADAEVIENKLDIDESIEELDEIYRAIYDKIKEANKGKTIESNAINAINTRLGEIEKEIDRLWDTRDDYTSYRESELEEETADMENKYKGVIDNLNALATGGKYYSGWANGNWNDEGEWEEGYWMSSSDKQGLDDIISDYVGDMQDISTRLDELKELCDSADSQKATLATKIDALETKLNSGTCSEALKDGMTKKSDKTGKSIIEEYRELLAYDISAMADAMLNVDKPQIQRFCEMINSVCYDQANIDRRYSIQTLGSFNMTSLPIDVEYLNRMTPSNQAKDELGLLDGMTPDKYSLDAGDAFESFESEKFKSTENPEFYKKLKQFYSKSADEEDKAQALEDGLEALLGDLKLMFDALLVYDPAGAHKLVGGADGSTASEATTFAESDWGADGGTSTLKNAMNDGFFAGIGSALDDAANKVLLLAYASEMFSCYATPNSAEEGVEAQLTMTGVPLSTDVNYFFQSELEYLFHGNQTDAIKNLQSITGMILLVRFVFNYVSCFAINSVNATVDTIKTSLAWAGPVAIAVGELARIVIALGESVIDVGRLKDGSMVAVIKDNSTWRFSIEGLIDAAAGTVNKLAASDLNYEKDNDEGLAIGYRDYLRIFLLFVNGDKMASRVCDLIELNMTTKTAGIGSNDHEAMEEAMSKAERYDMSKAVTGFSLTTGVNLKMMFLSMPFAQKGLNGTVPPGSLHISATDYRGY